MPQVLLGNVSVQVPPAGNTHVVHTEGEAPPAPEEIVNLSHLGQQITTVNPGGTNLTELVGGVSGAWAAHSDQAPAWVESSDKKLEARLSELFDCPIGCPVSHDEWKDAV